MPKLPQNTLDTPHRTPLPPNLYFGMAEDELSDQQRARKQAKPPIANARAYAAGKSTKSRKGRK